MTDQAIIESGMTFGPYPAGHCFYIEQSQLYKKLADGVPIAEFLLLRMKPDKPSAVWIIEAKSSSPRPEAQPNFNEFIDEIRLKFVNSLALGLAACLGRHPSYANEIPSAFKTLDWASTQFRLVLVINGHKKEWLVPLQEALNKVLRPFAKTWSLPATQIVVINEELAVEKGLILPSAV